MCKLVFSINLCPFASAGGLIPSGTPGTRSARSIPAADAMTGPGVMTATSNGWW
jgi:hypothetical protein